MAKALLDWETIGVDQLDDIMAGRPPRPPKDLSPPPAGRGPTAPQAPDVAPGQPANPAAPLA